MKMTQALRTERIERLLKLLAIPGTSGEERAVSDHVRAELLAAGAKSEWITEDRAGDKTPVRSGVGNLICRFPGSTTGPTRLLMAHLDTVPICVGCEPVKKGTRIESRNKETGLGADNRAGCAVILGAAIELLRESIPHPPLTFLWTVQEETGLHGARLVDKSLLGKPALAFNWDGGSPEKLTIGATGGYRMTIEVRGIASHAGGAPEQGVSAIAIAGLAIAQLQSKGWHGAIRKGKSRGTSNIGVISGGNATNVVCDYVRLRAEARSHDPIFRSRIVAEIERAFAIAAEQVANEAGLHGEVSFDGRVDYESFRLADDSPTVRAAALAVEATGKTPELAISNGGLDANWLSSRGIPTVTLGCGQRNQHMKTEWADIPEFLFACSVAKRLATGE